MEASNLLPFDGKLEGEVEVSQHLSEATGRYQGYSGTCRPMSKRPRGLLAALDKKFWLAKEIAMPNTNASCWAVLMLAPALLVGCGQPEEVRARAFVLTDSADNVRARLSVTDSGFAALRFYEDGEGSEAVRVSLRPTGLELFDKSGRRVEIAVADGGTFLYLYDDEYPRAGLSVDEGSTTLALHGPSLEATHYIQVPDDAPSDIELPESVSIPPPPN